MDATLDHPAARRVVAGPPFPDGEDFPRTLCEALQRSVERYPDRVALRTLDGFEVTWAEYGAHVRATAAALHGLGVRPGDSVALLVSNRPAFHVLDSAALHLGATPFSVYPTSSPEQIAHLLGDAGARVVVCDEDRLDAIAASGAELDHAIGLPGDEAAALVAVAGAGTAGAGFDFDAGWRAVEPDTLATLIYTSGTTGPPKGVQITHRNALTTARAVAGALEFPEASTVISYLPFAHVAERNNSHWIAMAYGFTATSCTEPRRVAEFLPDVRPVWFFGVPRIFEKLQAAIEAGATPERAAAIDAARRRLDGDAAAVPDEAELAAIRAEIGLDRAAAVNVGAAPAVPEMLRFFHAIGVPLAELWGMSELCGSGTVNRRDAIKIGTAGPPMPGVEIRLADDGEIEVRTDATTPGYRNQAELTAELFTADGWVRTGDIGRIDADGHLSIVDRKKELIINAAGKNMSPAYIEAQVKGRSLVVGQVLAVGDRRPYNVALIVLDPEGARAFAREHGLAATTPERLAAEPAVLAEVSRAVEQANAALSRVEGIKRFRLLAEEWTADGGQLTPTMKLRRRVIQEQYATLIEELYD